MKRLLENLDRWQEKLRKRPLLLALDFDGTLAKIAPTPNRACMSAGMRDAVKQLTALKSVKVHIISGRGLQDLKRKVGLKKVVLIGSHGLEWQGRGAYAARIPAEYQNIIHPLKNTLTVLLSRYPGVYFENKPASLAIHYRQVSRELSGQVKKAVLELCRPFARNGYLDILCGKKVVELLPSCSWNKGRALNEILRKYPQHACFPIYIGDDRTDESAFHAVSQRGLAVKVGFSRWNSAAMYCLDDVDEVEGFLQKITTLRDGVA